MKRLVLAALLCLSTTLTQAAGLKFLNIPADSSGPPMKAAVWTPCAAAAQPIPVGPFVLSGQRDCPTVGEKLPLIVISHGHGGTNLGHHDLAETLANAGFVVAAINHPGDTHSDMSRADDISVYVERPTDIKRLIDYMLSASPDAAKIDPQSIGFFGFSRGGYTGLVLAGGKPDFLHADVACPDPGPPVCQEIRHNQIPTAPLTRDPRIKAYVLADPLNEFPTAASLKDVKAPIQLWASEFGGDGVLPETSPALATALPARPEFHLVRGAAHFAFLAPCPADMEKTAAEICVDSNGFNRVAFHDEFDEAVLKFFEANLRK